MKLQKSLSLSIAVLLMLCIVAACGGSPAPAAPTGAFSEKDLGVEIGGKVYYLREDSAALLAAAGISQAWAQSMANTAHYRIYK